VFGLAKLVYHTRIREVQNLTLWTRQYEILAAYVFNALAGAQPQTLWTSRIRSLSLGNGALLLDLQEK
jgi:hypothetical protein